VSVGESLFVVTTIQDKILMLKVANISFGNVENPNI